MRISPPKIAIYGRTIDEAYDLICHRGLRNCEPCATPWLGIWIGDTTDLELFRLRFAEELDFEERLIIVPPGLMPEVDDFIIQTSIEERIQRVDLTAVRFWDTDDEAVFAGAWG